MGRTHRRMSRLAVTLACSLALAWCTAAAADCSFPCDARATCNEAERRCDCAPGLRGVDCSELAVPSCVLRTAFVPALAAQAPPGHSRSCACIREWVALLQEQELVGVSWMAVPALVQENACWDAPPGTPVLDVWALAAAGALNQSHLRLRSHHGTAPAEVSVLPLRDADRPTLGLDVAPMQLCPSNCSLHGYCTRRLSGLMRAAAFPDDKPHCVCWGGREGDACEWPEVLFPKDGSPWCLNACRGRGACVRGTCACERGFWGPDCGATAAGLLRGRSPALQAPTPPPGLPAVYVYDLPPSLVSWHLWLAWAGLRADWLRTAGWRFLETALRSAARVPAATNATVFVVPVAGAHDVDRRVAFEYVRRTYPHLDANIAAARGPNHLFPIMPHDAGLGGYDDMVPALLRSPNGSAGVLPDFNRHSIFLSHHSLHLGYSRGFIVENQTWWPVPPAREMPRTIYAGTFVPGKDVFAAAADKQLERCRSLPELMALNKSIRVWWAGTVRPGTDANSVRALVASLLANVSGFNITTRGGADETQGMLQSEFCIAPPGTGGGYGSRDARAVGLGCAPVYIQDHTSQPMDELLPVSLYGLAVAEADIARLPSMLNESALVRDRPAALQQLACACRALRWPWVTTELTSWEELRESELALQDQEGGWASLLKLLDRRQHGAGPLDDACAAVPQENSTTPLLLPPQQPPQRQQEAPRTAVFAAGGDAQCGAYSEYLRSIYEDLTPWAGSGITEQMLDEAHKHTLQRSGEPGLSFLLRAGKLFVINGQRSDFARVDRNARFPHAKWLGTYVRVLQRLAETDGATLPDVEFVVSDGDHGPQEWDLDKPDSVRPPWSVRRSMPLLRYCKSDDRPEVLIPYHHAYEHKLSASFLDAPDGLPWEQRKDVLFGNHHGYARIALTAATARLGADGMPLPAWSGGSVRRYMTNLSQWAGPDWVAAADDNVGAVNATAAANSGVVRMEINRGSKPMLEWGRHKYVLHLDGITCSSKLEQALPLGSLVFKEESGYRSFFHRLLVPYQHYVPFWRRRPQELLDALAWARAHDAQAQAIAEAGRELARHFLSRDGLRCYWVLLLREYATLQRFVPGARLNASQLVPAAEYIDWARSSDNGTGAVFIEDIELL